MGKKKRFIKNKVMAWPYYRGEFQIIITNDSDKLKKLIPESNIRSVYAHTLFHEGKDGYETISIILNPYNKDRAMYYSCLAHEATHAAHMVLEGRGVIADFVNDEPVAYLVDWVVEQLAQFFDECGMLNKILPYEKSK